MREIVLDEEGMIFDGTAKFLVVEDVNLLFCPSKAGHAALWDEGAKEMHAHFGDLDKTTLTGEECFEELTGTRSCNV
jgi:hypothetical protein